MALVCGRGGRDVLLGNRTRAFEEFTPRRVDNFRELADMTSFRVISEAA